ncbi:MAG TPA: type III-B CRISPR module RAMP protein Cmr6 [Saprospiraceae bacterium]|nr:type III-B CRISPR module RAMP protein Cmr6 [Saprospiraceae bacterium]
MNLKHFYYRGYFDGRIKLSQPDKNTDARKKNEEVNEKAFRLKNATLTSTEYVSPFVPTHIQSIGTIQDLRLQVQNPGLLPGIGYPHEVGYPGEFKLGFGFDHVTGLPVLPGSSVKGVLRSVFPQFKHDAEYPGNFEAEDALQIEKSKYIVGLLRRFELDVPAESELEKVKKLAHQLDLSIFCGFSFEKEEKPARLPMSKHDVFFDALPVNFNEKDQLLGRDALTPHGDNPLKNPIPLPFLKVMPGVVFGFYFRLQDSKIGSLTITAEHKRRIFGEILCTVGAGAKTNVGYGQFDTNNIADRIQPMNKAAASPKTIGKFESQSPAISQPAAATSTKLKSFPFNKSLNGKNIIGEVQRIVGSEVWFKVLNVEGFEKEISDKNPSASRFEIGKQYELRVNEVSSDKGILKAKISSLKPLN